MAKAAKTVWGIDVGVKSFFRVSNRRSEAPNNADQNL